MAQLTKYVDTKLVVSVAVGVALFGALVFAANASGISGLKKAADVVKG
jgi:hypothetical protein